MRVLIAGSDAEFLEVLQSYLARHGHEAEIATDGLECIAILRDVRPDVLVLESDLLWGGSDGVLALRQDDLLLRHVPVIFIAGTREEFDAVATSSVVAWLCKPFRVGELLWSLAEARRRLGHQRVCRRELAVRMETYFNMFCPVCGRPLHVLVQLLGQRVACGHCRGSFVAIEREDQPIESHQVYGMVSAQKGCKNRRFGSSSIPLTW